jgi:hypothetical protein
LAVSWCQESSNWGLTESELKDRGLRALTFYDIVLDFIFLDAFEDLEAPPASVLAVTQNRWLSNSFKVNAIKELAIIHLNLSLTEGIDLFASGNSFEHSSVVSS